jgi:Kef-type K+ transport system membrane component KefB
MELDFTFANVFYEIAALVLLATVLGFAGLLLRQPLIVAFIAAGVLAGPDVLGLVSSADFVGTLSQISIAVLLFLVGLKLDLNLVRSLGKVAVATGLGQVVFTAAFGFLICLALGLDALTSLYIAVALTFSSTIIIVKLLSDKQEIDSLHGKVALGFLIVQDLFVVLAMVLLSAIGIGSATEGSGFGEILKVLAGGALSILFVGVFIRYAATPLLSYIARSPELLVIFAVGWAAGFAALGDAVGLGKEMGGLLAGVSLASTPYRDSIGSRLSSLRDFLLLFFFIDLGASLELSTLGAQLFPAAILSLFVLIGNPMIVMAIMGYMGFRKRTGLLAGLTVAQISEFSLIFMAMGITLGHVNEEAMGLVTLVGLVTIALSVYMITYSHHIYDWLAPLIGAFERKVAFRETSEAEAPRSYDFIVFGLGRYGRNIGQHLRDRGYRVLGIDFDPEAVAEWSRLGLDGRFGDATDPEFAGHLPLGGVRGVVSAVSRRRGPLTEADPHLALLHGLKAARFDGQVAVAVNHRSEGDLYLKNGATLVLAPYEDAAGYAAERLVET